MADIDNVTVGENNYNLRDSAAQNALPTQGQVDDIITALNTIANKTDHPYNPDNKLPSDYVNDANQTHKFATQAQLSQIETNKNNILSIADHYKYDSRILFEQEAIPTGTIANGSTWIDGDITYKYNSTTNIVGGTIEKGTWNAQIFRKDDSTNRCRLSNSIKLQPSTTYTITLNSPTISNARLLLQYRSAGGGTVSESGWQSTLPYTFTTPANSVGATILFSNSGDLVCSVSDFGYLQINEGSTALTYAKPSWESTLATINPALIECIDNGNKNLLYYTLTDLIKANTAGVTWSGNVCTHTDSGMTFTCNSDGSITVNGTNTGSQFAFILCDRTYGNFTNLGTGTYMISGCPTGGGNSTYVIFSYLGKTTSPQKSYTDEGNGVEAYLDFSNKANAACNLAIVIKASATLNNIVFKPMVCTKSQYVISNKYRTSSFSNTELTNNANALVNNDRKNMINLYSFPMSVGGVTITQDLDTGELVFNGTASGTGFHYAYIGNVKVEAGKVYGFVDFKHNTTITGSLLYSYISPTTAFSTEYPTFAGARANRTAILTAKPSIVVRLTGGTTYNNCRLAPMLFDGDITDSTYQPPAETNSQLTQKLQYAQFRRTMSNISSVTFNVVRTDTQDRYHYGFVLFGNVSNLPSIYTVFIGAETTNPTVSFAKVGGEVEATLTGSVVYDGFNVALTITSTSTFYGGVRLVWMD